MQISDIAVEAFKMRCYLPYKRMGKLLWRRYNRELKNGRGKSLLDFMLTMNESPNALVRMLNGGKNSGNSET